MNFRKTLGLALCLLSLCFNAVYGASNYYTINGATEDGVVYINYDKSISCSNSFSIEPTNGYTVELSANGNPINELTLTTNKGLYKDQKIEVKVKQGNTVVTKDTIIVKELKNSDINIPKSMSLCRDNKTNTAIPKEINITPKGGNVTLKDANGRVINDGKPSSSGNYNVSVSFGGCTKSQNIDVDVPDMSLKGADNTLCANGKITVTALGMDEDSYIWDDGTKSPSKVIEEGGTYSVSGTIKGCTLTKEFTITQIEALEVSIEGITAICPGETQTTITAEVATTSESDITYIWSKDGDEIDDAYEQSYTVTEPGRYSVEIYDNISGCPGSANKPINKLDAVPLPQVKGPYEICSGGSITIEAATDGLAELKWSGGKEDKNNKFNRIISDAGTYTVYGITADRCQGNSVEFQTTLKSAPAILISDLFPCTGQDIEIVAHVSNCTNCTFRWSDITNAKDPARTDTIRKITNGSGKKKCTAYAKDGNTECVTQTPIDIVFVDPPTIEITGKKTYCSNEKTFIVADTKGTGKKSSFKWERIMDNDTILVVEDSILNESLAAGTYKFLFTTITNEYKYECESSEEIEVIVNPIPQFTVAEPKQLCEGGNVTLTASSTEENITYQWKETVVENKKQVVRTISNTGSATVSVAKTYTVTATNQHNCTASKPVTVEDAPKLNVVSNEPHICKGEKGGKIILTAVPERAFTCDWRDGVKTNEHSFTGTETYTVTLTDSLTGCSKSMPVHSYVDETPTGKIDTSGALCRGGDVTATANFYMLSGNKSKLTYKWSDGTETNKIKISDDNEYIVTVETEAHCQAKDTIKLTMNELPTLALSDPAPVCIGEETEFVFDDSKVEYHTESGSTITSPYKVIPSKSGNNEYKFFGIDKTTKCKSNEVVKSVTADDRFDFSLTGNPSICVGSKTELALSSETADVIYNWTITKEGEDPTISTGDKMQFDESASYVVTASKSGSSCTSEKRGSVYLLDSVKVIANDKNLCKDEKVTLDASSTESISEYRWIQNGDTLSTSRLYEVDKAGTYSVKLMTSGGCWSDEKDVVVTEREKPTVSLKKDKPYLCPDGEVELTAVTDEANNVSWKTDNGYIVGNDTTNNVTKAGTYIAVVTNEYECVKEDTIDVVSARELDVIETHKDVCDKDTGTVTLSSPTGMSFTCVWQGEEDETKKTKLSYDFTETATLTAILTDTKTQCVKDMPINVIVYDNPTGSIEHIPSICDGKPTMVTAQFTVTDGQMLEYSWDGREQKTINNTYVISDELEHTVVVTSAGGCIAKDTVKLKVNPNPTLEINGEDYICADSFAVLTAVATSTAVPDATPFEYRWDNGDTTATANVTTAGTHTAIVIDKNGCSDTASVNLTMRTPMVTISGLDEFCTDSVLVLSGYGTAEYYWEGAERTEANNKDKYTVTSEYVESTKTITLVGYDEMGCKTTTTKTVKKRPVPTLDIAEITKFCENGETVVNPTPSVEMKKYVWDGEDQATGSHTINKERDYTVQAYDTYDCPTIEYTTKGLEVALPTVTIEGDDYLCDGMNGKPLTAKTETGETFKWSTGETTQEIEVTKSGTYTVRTYIGVCESEPANFDITISAKPEVSIAEGESSDFCENIPHTLHAVSPTAVSYNWDNGASAKDSLVSTKKGKHTVVVADAKGCENSATTNMIEHSGPHGLAIEGDAKICEFDRAPLTAGCPECVRFEWNTGEISETIYATETGDYSVVSYNTYGCPSLPVTHHLFVSPAPVVNITGETELMIGEETTLTAEVEGSEPFKYYWTPTREKTESIVVKSEDINLIQKYSVRVTDPYGCSGDASTPVKVVAVKLSGTQHICDGEKATMTVRGNDVESVVWSNGSTDLVAEFDEEGVYYAEVTLKNGTVNRLDFGIWVHPYPTVSIEGNESICRGDSLMLTVKSDLDLVSAMWSFGIDTTDVWIRDEGEYKVVGTTEYGCSSEATKSVIVNELPDVKIIGPTELVEETTITLTADGADTYHWTELDTTDISVEIDSAGVYHLSGTDNNGCRNTTKHEVVLVPIPHPLINDTVNGHAIICEGDEYTLIASGGKTYTWDDGQTTDAIKVTESRVYTVTACLDNGQCREQTFSVDVVPRPKLSMIEGELMFCPEGNTTLTAKTNEEQPIDHYVWNTGEQTESILADQVGEYSVYGVSIYGCLSDTLKVETGLYDAPILLFEGTTELCEGSNTTITVKGAERYSWEGQDNETDRITIAKAGTYIVDGWDEHECKSTLTINIQDLGSPSIEIIGDENICEGEERTLKVAGDRFANTFIKWNTGEESEEIVVKEGGEYSVIVSNHEGCEARANFTMTPRPNPVIAIDGEKKICLGHNTKLTAILVSGNELKDYQWSNGESKNPFVTIDKQGDVSLIATDIFQCKSNEAHFDVEVITPSPVVLSGDFDICRERLDTAIIYAECSDAVNYVWTNLSSDELVSGNDKTNSFRTEGTYKVTAIDINSCESEYKFEIVGHDNPVIDITGAEIPVCNKEFATLSAVSNGERMSYVWNTGEEGTSIFPSESGDFSVVGTDMYNCYSDASTHLIFNDIPKMTAEESYGFCPGESVTITMVGADEYVWSNGETSSSATFNTQTSAFVIGRDRYECEKRLDFEVREFIVPQYAVATTPPYILRTNPEVNFKLTSEYDLSTSTISWMMNDGGEMQGTEFDYSFDVTNQTKFSVAVSLETLEGCRNDTTLLLNTDLDIPNTITPNGDGVNDHFMRGCHVEIYDRHDGLIYKGEDGWDGKLKNGEVTADTYWYVLTDIDGKKYYGYITVLMK